MNTGERIVLKILKKPFPLDEPSNVSPKYKRKGDQEQAERGGQEVPFPERVWIDKIGNFARRRRQSWSEMIWIQLIGIRHGGPERKNLYRFTFCDNEARYTRVHNAKISTPSQPGEGHTVNKLKVSMSVVVRIK